MHGVLNIALQSMQHDMARLERTGSNIANTLSPGYKREMIVERPFSDLVNDTAIAQSQPLVNGQVDLETIADHRAGTLKTTNENLDLALSGKGYFEISATEGPAYTRKGNFQIDARGRLVTSQGYPVMGKSGEIFLTNNSPVIDAAGNVFENKSAANAISQLKIVQIEDEKALKRIGDGLLVADAGLATTEAKDPQVRQGALENSNVSSMHEMVQLMQTMRHFESMQKVATGYDEMIGLAVRKLGEVS